MKLKLITHNVINYGVVFALLVLQAGCASKVPMLPVNPPQADPGRLQVAVDQTNASNNASTNPTTNASTNSSNTPASKQLGFESLQANSWWALLGDDALNALVERAWVGNTDVRLANERLHEASSRLGMTRSAQYPALFAQLSESRNRPTQAGNVPVFGGRNVYENTRLGLAASWELDLWGKLASATDAARATLLQQNYTVQAAKLSVAASVVLLYTQAQVQGLQVQVLEQTEASRAAAMAIAKQRAKVGLATELQWRQAEAELQTIKAQLPDAREQFQQTLNALAALVGSDTVVTVAPITMATLEQGVGMVLVPPQSPSELLLRRADVAAAEAQLSAQNADVEVARKAFFPSIDLTGFAGRESTQLATLFSGPARVWNFQAQLTQPLFQAGRLQFERDATIARRNQSVVQYEAAIRRAFQETYDALVAQQEAGQRLGARQVQVQTLQVVERLARARVETGLSPQLELLDAQRNVLNAQLASANAWLQQRAALVGLIRALGGGFNR